MAADLTITELDARTAPAADLLPAAKLIAAVEAQCDGLAPRSAELELAWWRVHNPDVDDRFVIVGDLADPDGVAVVGLDTTAENGHAAYVGLGVAPERRRRGVGRALVDAVEAVVTGAGRRTIVIMSLAEAGEAAPTFAAAVGYEVGLVMRGSALDPRTVDRSLVAEWSAALDPAYEVVEVDGAIPDEHVDAFLEAVGAMNDAPRDGLDLADEVPHVGRTRYYEELTRAVQGQRRIMIARHRETGAGAGFSSLWWEPGRHSVAFQGGTGVSRDHRGHGLGRVLKARMLERLAADAPELTSIRTDNAHTNPWMLRINDDLGFVPFGDLTEWQKQLVAEPDA